ncbi:hypothetical protein ACLI1Y_15685 [Enterococcus faecalis]|uniref:hypothetical protein n=1 Tax=Enterococcus faecalis TaxID=1351 RepID=UPI00398516A9
MAIRDRNIPNSHDMPRDLPLWCCGYSSIRGRWKMSDPSESAVIKLMGYAHGFMYPDFIHLTRVEAQVILQALERLADLSV